jgi:hypothetical protein
MPMQAESLEVLEKASVDPAQARAIVRAIEIEIAGAKDTLATKSDLLPLLPEYAAALSHANGIAPPQEIVSFTDDLGSIVRQGDDRLQFVRRGDDFRRGPQAHTPAPPTERRSHGIALALTARASAAAPCK